MEFLLKMQTSVNLSMLNAAINLSLVILFFWICLSKSIKYTAVNLI